MRFLRNFDPNQKPIYRVGKKKFKIFFFFFFIFFLFLFLLNSEKWPSMSIFEFFLSFSLKLKSLKKIFSVFFIQFLKCKGSLGNFFLQSKYLLG
jgi:hypothetical protein